MLHRLKPRSLALHRPRGDVGSTLIEVPLRAAAWLLGGLGVCFVVLRVKAKFDAFVAGRPAPPLLPEVTIAWGTVGLALGGLALATVAVLIVLAWRSVAGERQAEQRRRTAFERRHDRVLEELGCHLVDDPHRSLLDEPALIEALARAQDARNSSDDHRYLDAVRALQAQWTQTRKTQSARAA
ncbi:hypothetical protein [Streptomyces sp. NPDC046909]|uniref:hypothetical protein n=1 Tax=Streptomyces sp. NPDC046909 TaxID=3155617 RepID=UPI0033FC7D2D